MSQLSSASQGASPAVSSEPENRASSARAKPRSCTICRARKVRCDKQMPCSNCKRAQIPCVLPQPERPRWARRLQQSNAAPEAPSASASASASASTSAPAAQESETAAQLLGRLRNLEGMVKDLSGQLEVARAQAHPSPKGSADGGSPDVQFANSSNRDDAHIQASIRGFESQINKLGLNPAGANRFWSKINDELRGLEMETRGLADAEDSEESEDEGTPEHASELNRLPLERNSLLFSGLSGPNMDLKAYYPLPSQVPFLLEIFFENVNLAIGVVHVPTVNKLLRRGRNNELNLTPANEALMFSMYYSAVVSMEDDDVLRTFGCTKTELTLKFRTGLELAFSKADFLYVPDLTIVQALTIFLAMARRHDSPKFVWIMTGLLVRLGHALALQKDPSRIGNLTAYEKDMRRRLWAAICGLDIRTAEDQGTELSIPISSFDTKFPGNYNETDIDPDSSATEDPPERDDITDNTFSLVSHKISNVAREMVAPGQSLDQLAALLQKMETLLYDGYLKYKPETRSAPGTTGFWASFLMIVCTKLVVSKMKLLTNLPVLFSSPSEHLSPETRNRLFIAALETAEYNHALHAEPMIRSWRWIYETYSQWHAVIFICLEVSRRPWSAIVERAWTALQSPYLIPIQVKANRNPEMWIPLRKLLAKARKHREAELQRLRNDTSAAQQLDLEEQSLPVPESPSPMVSEASHNLFQVRWRELVGLAESPFVFTTPLPPAESPSTTNSNMGTSIGTSTVQSHHTPLYPVDVNMNMNQFNPSEGYMAPGQPTYANLYGPPMPPTSEAQYYPPIQGFQNRPVAPENVNWLWADNSPADVFANLEAVDTNMDLDQDLDWHTWVQSMGQGGDGQM